MPILHVRALPQKDPERIQGALTATCAVIAAVAGNSREYFLEIYGGRLGTRRFGRWCRPP